MAAWSNGSLVSWSFALKTPFLLVFEALVIDGRKMKVGAACEKPRRHSINLQQSNAQLCPRSTSYETEKEMEFV